MPKEPLSKKLTHGIFYLLSSSVITVGLNAISVGFIARKLGVESFGLYSAIFSFVGLFEFLSDFGLNKTLLRFGATDINRTKVSFGNALLLKGMLIIPSITLILTLGYLAGYRGITLQILFLFSLSLVLDSFSAIFSSIRRIFGNFKLISFFRVLKTFINLLIVFTALNYNSSVFTLALANTLLSIIVFLISLINTILLIKPSLDLKLFKEFFKSSSIFSISDFLFNIYGKISTVLLSLLSNMHTVGIYSAAIKFTKIANLFPNQVRFAMLPSIYKILEEKAVESPTHPLYSKRKKVFNIIFKYMVILATPSAILIFFFSDSIIHLIFGRKYDLSILLVKLFSFFIYLRFLETPFTLFYIGLIKHKRMLFFQTISTSLSIILNILLIPKYSYFGACYSTLISESVFMLGLFFWGLRYSIWNLKESMINFLRPTISALISVGIVVFLFNNLNIFIKIIFLLVLYIAFLLLFKTFNQNDKELFSRIFHKSKNT